MRIRVRPSVTVTLAFALALDVARTRTLTAGHQAGCCCCSAACDGGERNGLAEVKERTAGGGGGRIATISPPPPSGVRARVSKARRLTGDVAAAGRACCCGTAGSPGVLALWRSRRSSAALYAARVAAGWPTWISESLGGSAFTMRSSESLQPRRGPEHAKQSSELLCTEKNARKESRRRDDACEAMLGVTSSLTCQQSELVGACMFWYV